jgi:hypothetical protein
MSAELEEARALGELRKQGWQPKRTIIYAAWDGEEPALLGSTEWVETHAAELEAHAVVYINTDSNGRGYLGMAGSHTLEPFINGVARAVEDTPFEASPNDGPAEPDRNTCPESGTDPTTNDRGYTNDAGMSECRAGQVARVRQRRARRELGFSQSAKPCSVRAPAANASVRTVASACAASNR